MDKRLAKATYFAGGVLDRRHRDLPVAALLEEPGHRLDEFPHFKGWFDEIAARPAVQRGVEVLASLRKPLAGDKEREVLFGATAVPAALSDPTHVARRSPRLDPLRRWANPAADP